MQGTEIQLSIITTILVIGVPVLTAVGGWILKANREDKLDFKDFRSKIYQKLDDLCDRVARIEGAHEK